MKCIVISIENVISLLKYETVIQFLLLSKAILTSTLEIPTITKKLINYKYNPDFYSAVILLRLLPAGMNSITFSTCVMIFSIIFTELLITFLLESTLLDLLTMGERSVDNI